MDAASILSLPSSPAPSGLQIFAIFVNFFFPGLALIVVTTRAAGRFATNQFVLMTDVRVSNMTSIFPKDRITYRRS